MPKEMIVIAYAILCIIVGLLGRRKTIGFWGFLFFSALLTPFVGFAILVIAKDKGAPLVCRQERRAASVR